MNEDTRCDEVRLQLMAATDGEREALSAPDTQHVSTCPACQRWRLDFEAMRMRLRGLPYPSAEIDLWTAVHDRIHARDAGWSLTHRLLVIGAVLLAWRALQLLFDLPLPLLHPLVPIAAAGAALWQITGDPLAIETFAPELQKRGV